jgi:molybdate transport system regulatory protein
MAAMPRMRLHISFEGEHSLGPGKAQLLEGVRELGSISAAARAMGMAYRHAWVLLEDLRSCFGGPLIETQTGGAAGGGARLTPLGAEVLRRFRLLERASQAAATRQLRALDRLRSRRP